MGLFDGARGAICGNKAYRVHVDAGKLAGEGKVAQAKQRYQEALRLYEEAERLGVTAQNILQAYALLLMREGEFEKSKALMEKTSRMKRLTDEDWFQLRVQYSILQWRTGELDKAIETIGRAAKHKMNGNIYATLGMYLVDRAKQTGDFAEALEFNGRAMDYDDEDAATLDNMAQLYEAMSRSETAGENAAEYRRKALDFYEKAHAAKPRQITTIYCLARMLHEDGDDARARKLLAPRDTLYITAICPVTRQMLDELAKAVG